jgi:tetratricopeptide (TPR) repeat protein
MWINRGLEALWLLAVVLVPIVALGRSLGEWSSVIGSYELPKIALLRALTGLMAILWLAAWALRGRISTESAADRERSRLPPTTLASKLTVWLRGQPVRWLTLAVAAYLVTVLLSTALSASFNVSAWGDVPGQDGYSAYTVLAYILLFAVIATHLKTPAQTQRLLWAIVAMGVLVAGYGVLQHYGQDFLDLKEGGPGRRQASSTLGNVTFAGALLLMTIPMTLAAATMTIGDRVRTGAFWLKLGLWVLVLAVQLLGVTLTLSRAPWLGTFVALAGSLGLAGIFVGWRALARGIAVLCLAVVLILPIVLIPSRLEDADTSGESNSQLVSVTSDVLDRLSQVGSSATVASEASQRLSQVGSGATAGGISGRVAIWKTSWGLMLHRPWFEFDGLSLKPLRPVIGYGPDLFRSVYLLDSPPPIQGWLPHEADHAHNYFMHQGVELGFLGLLASAGIFAALFAIGVYQLLSRGRTLSAPHKLVLAALLATFTGRFVEQLFGVARVSDLTIWWVLMALFAALPVVMGNSQLVPSVNTGARNPGRPIRALSRPGIQRASLQWKPLGRAVVVAGLAAAIILLTWAKGVNYVRAAFIADDAAADFRKGRLQDSLTSLDEAIALAPEVSSYRGEKPAIYRASAQGGNSPGALACGLKTAAYEECLARESLESNLDWVKRRPLQYRAQLALADSSRALGRLTGDAELIGQATALYQKAAEMVPNSPDLRILVARILLQLGRPEEALLQLEQSLSITGEARTSSGAYLLQAKAHRAMGLDQQAIEDIESAMRVAPGYGPPFYERGIIYHGAGQLDKALEDFNEAIRLSPRDPDAHFLRGTMLYDLGDYTVSVEALTRAIGLDPSLARAYNNRGLAYARLGRQQAASRDFNRAIILDPELAPAFNNRGLIYREMGQLRRAVEDLTRAIELDPQFTMAFYNRALANAQLGKDLEAQLDAQRAVELGLDVSAVDRSLKDILRPR